MPYTIKYRNRLLGDLALCVTEVLSVGHLAEIVAVGLFVAMILVGAACVW